MKKSKPKGGSLSPPESRNTTNLKPHKGRGKKITMETCLHKGGKR